MRDEGFIFEEGHTIHIDFSQMPDTVKDRNRRIREVERRIVSPAGRRPKGRSKRTSSTKSSSSDDPGDPEPAGGRQDLTSFAVGWPAEGL